MKRIARIVKSNSHLDYVCRVIDRLDAEDAPAADDYGFAQCVSFPVSPDEEIVGVVYDTQLANPDYGSYGPRLSPRPELAVLTPDVLNEQGILLGVLLIGWCERTKESNWVSHHRVPRRVLPVGQEVFQMSSEDVLEFHRAVDGSVRVGYFPQLTAHAGAYAGSVLEALIEQLEPGCSPIDRRRLNVLKKSLIWQRTLGNVRL